MSDKIMGSYLPSEADYSEENAKLINNGVIQAVKIEMSKPGATYLNLNNIFHGKVGDFGTKTYIPCFFTSWDNPITNVTASIEGKFPSDKPFHVTPYNTTAGNGIFNMEFPAGFFQEQGRYRFNFVLENDTTKITSKNCFFDVEQSMINVAIDCADGIDIYDNQYQEWKAQVEKDISDFREQIITTQKTLSDIKGIAQKYESDVSDYADQAWANKLNGENTWTGQQHFNSGLTANSVNSSGDIQGANVNGTDLKLNNKSLKWVKNGDCMLEGLAEGSDGTRVSYWTNANTLYITGWVAKPKTAYKTFRAYLPTSITQRAINLQNYYVAVNDEDWNNPTTSTNPTEFHLDGNKGIIYVNGSGNDGGARLDWIVPLKDA